MLKEKVRPRLKDIGELGLINRIQKYVGARRSVIKGIGDDTAVVPLSSDKYMLLTTDMLVEGRHFTRKTPAHLIGRKAMACNLSDIAAMGGTPQYALVSTGLPPSLPWSFVKGIYQGMLAMAKKYNVSIVGGDTVASEKMIINVSMVGEILKGFLVTRKGAKPGNSIYVTGPLGKSLKSQHHLTFHPRLKESQYLARYIKPSSMIDISDGLASDLGHILIESKVGARIWEREIPRRRGAGIQEALYDGEDFELLFTVSKSKEIKLNLQKRMRLYKIGEIIHSSGKIQLVRKNGESTLISRKGFQHF